MKKLLSLLIISLFTASAFAQLTEGERAFAIKYLQATQQDVIATVSELSDEAWNYIPEDGGWSVANCLEHILVSEEAFFGMGMGTVASTTPDVSIDFSMADAMMIGTMTNRGTQVTTSEAMEPSGRWATKEEMLAALEESRTKIIEYIQTTDDDLRHIKMELPLGEIDAYQMYLLVAAHSQRHTSQMKEVLAEMQAM